jgi:hypothetical protein
MVRPMIETLRVVCMPVQDADFLYLTGINQQAVAVIEASSPMRDGNFTLFIQDSNPQVRCASFLGSTILKYLNPCCASIEHCPCILLPLELILFWSTYQADRNCSLM